MTRRLTVVAGRGALAPLVVDAAKRSGDAVQVISIVGNDGPKGAERLDPDLQAIARRVRAFGTTHVCLAGAVDLSDGVRDGILAALGESEARSGDGGLANLKGRFEAVIGARLIGAHRIAPELLAEEGQIAGPSVPAYATGDAHDALSHARDAGRLDLGQAVVVSGRRVIAVEDIGGTDDLLSRVLTLRRRGLVGDGLGRLVLAKASKPRQPLFVDLPAIGPGTIQKALEAGIAMVVVEAGKSLVLEREQLVTVASAAGVAVVGLRLRRR